MANRRRFLLLLASAIGLPLVPLARASEPPAHDALPAAIESLDAVGAAGVPHCTRISALPLFAAALGFVGGAIVTALLLSA